MAGFIPKLNVPLEIVVDVSSLLLAEPKRLPAARPTFVWPLGTLNKDSVTGFEVTAADTQPEVFVEKVTAVFPKLNKLFIASVATGFG